MSTMTTRKLKWLAFLAVDAMLAMFLVWLLLVRAERAEVNELQNLGVNLYPQALPLQPFSLVDQSGASFTHDDLIGHWTFLFFGFTHCPNVCPLTMVELDQFYRRLQEMGDLVLPKVVFATVDPARDTPARLTEYLQRYSAEFTGVTGGPDQLSGLASQLYVISTGSESHGEHEDLVEPHAETIAQEFSHSAHISVINPDGELFAVIRLPHQDENLLAVYEYFLNQ